MDVSLHGPSVRQRVHALEGLSVWRAEQAQRTQAAKVPARAGDTVSLSAEALTALANGDGSETGSAHAPGAEALRGVGIYTARGRVQAQGRPESLGSEPSTTSQASDTASLGTGPTEGSEELTEQQQQEVDGLRARDAEVRRHEQAHAARGGSDAGGPQYDYKTGPDGQRYVADGSVSIDVSKVDGDLKATLRKMETVIAAATAPAQPSAQDHSVARAARATAQAARAELAAEANEAEDTQRNEGLDGSGARSVEGSEQYAAASSPIRPRLSPRLGHSLRAYQANAGPLGS
ncbi:MAG: hypothetical protein KUG77_24120 [Nannocystaceae bacterium]|nr:hypothetical protein [Nannocystaceae bacterium]